MAENPDRARVDTLCAHCGEPKDAHWIATPQQHRSGDALMWPIYICPHSVYEPVNREPQFLNAAARTGMPGEDITR